MSIFNFKFFGYELSLSKNKPPDMVRLENGIVFIKKEGDEPGIDKHSPCNRKYFTSREYSAEYLEKAFNESLDFKIYKIVSPKPSPVPIFNCGV